MIDTICPMGMSIENENKEKVKGNFSIYTFEKVEFLVFILTMKLCGERK